MLNMGAVLVLLIGVTDGVKTFCNATQPHITTQCFGSLGVTVKVQLPAQSSQNDVYVLRKNNVRIAKAAGIITDTRYSFKVSTGIFTIKDVNRSDIGTYSMDILNSDGKEIAETMCILSVQAPVSSPHLSRVCLSRGQQRVSCSAGGDGPHYSWSLDGHPLNDTHLLSGPSTASDITLELGLLGLLTCLVSNKVSYAAANITLSVCDVTELISIIARPLSVVVVLLVALGVYWALKKKKTSRHQDIPLSSIAEYDDGLYVNVSGTAGRAEGE